MSINNKTGLVGLLLALSALPLAPAEATTFSGTDTRADNSTIEQRLSRMAALIREREGQNSDALEIETEGETLAGWLNGRGRRGWIDTRRGDWLNGSRGGWLNGRGGSWIDTNRWRDGGSFWNSRW